VRYALVVARLPEEDPVVSSLLFKIFLFEPAWRFLLVPSPGPLPQTSEDGVINAVKGAFTQQMAPGLPIRRGGPSRMSIGRLGSSDGSRQ